MPKTEIAATGFDYSILDEDTAGKLIRVAEVGRRVVRTAQIKFIHDIGKELATARDLLAKHGEGTFIEWAKAEFDLSKSTIYNYLNGYGRCLSKAWTNYDSLTAEALYLATKESTPDSVIPKVKKLCDKRQVVTKADVQEIIDKENPPEPSPRPHPPPDTGTADEPEPPPGGAGAAAGQDSGEISGIREAGTVQQDLIDKGDTVRCVWCNGTGRMPKPKDVGGFQEFRSIIMESDLPKTARFRKNPKGTEKAWKAACKRLAADGYEDPEGLLKVQVKLYVDSHEATKDDAEFCPNATTWLNGERYLEHPEQWGDGKSKGSRMLNQQVYDELMEEYADD